MSDAGPESYDEVVASRARVLARADADRRALQGELHDGAQQRLVHALIALQLARAALEAGAPGADLLDEALTNVEQANRDLRAVVQRILPRSLVHAGLGSGLRSLVDDLAYRSGRSGCGSTCPGWRRRTRRPRTRSWPGWSGPPWPTLDAGRVELDVRLDGAALVIVVRRSCPSDDGAQSDHLTHVRDRVRAAGGRLTVAGDGRDGTAVRVELPVRPSRRARRRPRARPRSWLTPRPTRRRSRRRCAGWSPSPRRAERPSRRSGRSPTRPRPCSAGP